ncbi:non-specific serine/threonine protein kinase [Trifolium repens]|nr:non-specific serine/threonine protein kinase [Trifolium repens]
MVAIFRTLTCQLPPTLRSKYQILINKEVWPFIYHSVTVGDMQSISLMDFTYCAYLISVLFILLQVSDGIDTITSSQFIKDPETLISKDGNFTFGFFSPINTTNRYVGIWWKLQSTTIWVANRNQPLNDSNGIVTISEDGNLVVLNGQNRVIWSSNVSNIASNRSCQFSDFGNLVLLESTTGNILWQSIQQPSDTLLPGMKLSINKRTMVLGMAMSSLGYRE